MPTTPTSDSAPTVACRCQPVPRLTVVPGGNQPPGERIRVAKAEPCPDCAEQAAADAGGWQDEPAAGPPAERLLLWSEQLLEAHGPQIAGRWARAVAMLARQALETVLAERYATALPAARSAAVGHPAGSSLPPRGDRPVGDELLTARVDHTWRTLSRACAQPDETAPGPAQLRRWVDSVHAIVAALDTAAPSSP